MQQHTVVGVYKSRDDASDVRRRLISEGVPDGTVSLRVERRLLIEANLRCRTMNFSLKSR